MKELADELEKIVYSHATALLAIPEDKLAMKPSPVKWSKKEILGHLIDSAQNNIRRFIVAQYEEHPHIVYNQDKWVSLSQYQGYSSKDLVLLWQLLNKHIAIILRETSPENAQRKCQTSELHTIEWLAADYIRHLRHHLHQVLDLEPVAYP